MKDLKDFINFNNKTKKFNEKDFFKQASWYDKVAAFEGVDTTTLSQIRSADLKSAKNALDSVTREGKRATEQAPVTSSKSNSAMTNPSSGAVTPKPKATPSPSISATGPKK